MRESGRCAICSLRLAPSKSRGGLAAAASASVRIHIRNAGGALRLKKKGDKMKKAILAAALILVLASCSNGTNAEAGAHTGEIDSEPTFADTYFCPGGIEHSWEFPKTSDPAKTVTDTAEISDTADDSPEEPEALPELGFTLTINEDLFSDYGLSFDEIASKRGKVIHACKPFGGRSYEFENGYGGYHWSGLGYADWEWIEGRGFNLDTLTYPEPEDLCRGIDCRDLYKMFNEHFDRILVKALGNVEGLTYLETRPTYGRYSSYEWVSDFRYSRFPEVTLSIFHAEEEYAHRTSCMRFIRWADQD